MDQNTVAAPPVTGGGIFEGRSVLITGGTGTIGLEILRQILTCKPKVIRILSRDETKQAMVRMGIPREAPVRYLIGDLRDRQRLRAAAEGIDIVFHAAALKHVPACEYNPFEAVQTNVVGTQNLVEVCREVGVEKLVAISTDKAVNPVSTMGATKLLAENVLRDAQRWNSKLIITTVRFGNVLGSRGSLIPLMVSLMEEKREVELTSPSMTRFMMTIEDAVRLVLKAACDCRGGEIFILKMPSLRVADLIETFVEAYSQRRGWPSGSVQIRETGIRAGEKLHEELLTIEESTRLEERDSMFVVHPYRRIPAEVAPRILPAGCHSGTAPLLSRGEILKLLERAGLLSKPSIASPASPSPSLQEIVA